MARVSNAAMAMRRRYTVERQASSVAAGAAPHGTARPPGGVAPKPRLLHDTMSRGAQRGPRRDGERGVTIDGRERFGAGRYRGGKRLGNGVKSYDLLTIDVWDTLIRRNCHPDSSKLASARYVSLSHAILLKDEYANHWNIYSRRCAIEGELVRCRQSDGEAGEYTIEEVIGRLLVEICKDGLVNRAEMTRKICDYELRFEIEHSYPDDQITTLVDQQPAKSVYFLTDFYMPADKVAGILKSCGMRYLVDGGISSCDTGWNKRSGRLFHHVMSTFNVSPGSYMHIGDNVVSDVSVPSHLGIRALHFRPQKEDALRREKESLLSDRAALYRRVSEEVESIVRDKRKGMTGLQESTVMCGAKAAPLYIGFLLYVAERALMHGVDSLFFLSREGDFFFRVWRRIFPKGVFVGTSLPAAGILEVSRMATFAASLREIELAEAMRIWNQYSIQSLRSFLNSLGVSPDHYRHICDRHGITLEDDIVYPWQDRRVKNLFLDPEFRECLHDHSLRARDTLLGYLGAHGIDRTSGHIGIVDIGWRGTIQDNIALIMPHVNFSGYYMGLQSFLNDQPINCRKAAYGPNQNVSSRDEKLLSHVGAIEMLSSSPYGSVVGYERIDQNVVPVRFIDEEENKTYFNFSFSFQQGCLEAARVWASYIDRYMISSEELRSSALAIWGELHTQSNANLARAYASLRHNEMFGAGAMIEKNLPHPVDFFRALFDAKTLDRVLNYVRLAPAPNTALYFDTPLFHRLFAWFVLTLYRSLRRRRWFVKSAKRLMGFMRRNAGSRR